MGTEWKLTKLKNAGVSLIDCIHKTPPDVNEGIPYISIPQLKEGRIDFHAGPRLISLENYVEWTKKANPQENDVVLSRRCNPGETAFVPKDVRFALGQNLVLLRSDSTAVYPPFLRWLTRGAQWWAEVNKFLNVGAVFDSLKCADIPNFELVIPPMEHQKAISHILCTLDDKIELNRQMNSTLESMAQAMFKSWFVDFDPVIDNALAAGNPIPEPLIARAENRRRLGDQRKPLPQEIQQQFPSRFVLSEELGWIPEGWEAGKIGNIVAQRKEKAKQQAVIVLSAVATGELVPSAEHFTKQVYSKTTEKYLVVREWDIAYNPSRINIGSVGLLKVPYIGAVSPVYVVATPDYDYRWFLEFYLRGATFRKWVETLASGSVRQSLSYSDFASIPCIIPTRNTLQAFNHSFDERRQAMLSNASENNILNNLRDTLLPKLISGQLRLPDFLIEKFAEQANSPDAEQSISEAI